MIWVYCTFQRYLSNSVGSPEKFRRKKRLVGLIAQVVEYCTRVLQVRVQIPFMPYFLGLILAIFFNNVQNRDDLVNLILSS